MNEVGVDVVWASSENHPGMIVGHDVGVAVLADVGGRLAGQGERLKKS